MPQTRIVRIDGDALADIRARRGLTIVGLARMIGRHRQSINKLETGRSTHASTVFAWQIANALKVDISEFSASEDEGRETERPDCGAAA
jgi:predicted transcriptional regulator